MLKHDSCTYLFPPNALKNWYISNFTNTRTLKKPLQLLFHGEKYHFNSYILSLDKEQKQTCSGEFLLIFNTHISGLCVLQTSSCLKTFQCNIWYIYHTQRIHTWKTTVILCGDAGNFSLRPRIRNSKDGIIMLRYCSVGLYTGVILLWILFITAQGRPNQR